MGKISALANWKTILPLFLLFMLFMGYIFPNQQEKINAIANEELTSLDTRMDYSKEEVMVLFEKMGKEGRDIYYFVSSKIDMVYPIVYGLFVMFLMANFLKKVIAQNSKWRWMALLPILGGVFDYLENFNVQKLLSNYPNITEEQVAFAAQMTQLKWTSIMGMMLITAVLLLVFVVKKIKNR